MMWRNHAGSWQGETEIMLLQARRTGEPSDFMATRSWCVLPVSGFKRKARSGVHLCVDVLLSPVCSTDGSADERNRVEAGLSRLRSSIHWPRRDRAMSPRTVPCFFEGLRALSATLPTVGIRGRQRRCAQPVHALRPPWCCGLRVPANLGSLILVNSTLSQERVQITRGGGRFGDHEQA